LNVDHQIQDVKDLLNDPDLGKEAAAELEALQLSRNDLIRELKLMLVPSDPMDSRNVILEIRAGVGGEEAALFAGDLLRMYQKYADKANLNLTVLSVNRTDLNGISEALVMITGPEAFARLKFESGIHCVKRVPVTESSGRIHTSTASVVVLPEAEDMEVTINPADLRIDVYHASGHGGQGVNTTDSAVRITHLPTGMVVTCQDERSQLENKSKAMKVLRSRLLDQLRTEQEAATASSRSAQIKQSERSERIRTYYFNHDYVVDHRINMTLNRTSAFLNGELAPLIEALRLAEKTDRLNESI
jgi:peptide chain release factor 1